LGGVAAVGSGVLLVAGELMYFVVGLGESMEGSAATLSSPSSIFQSALFLLGLAMLRTRAYPRPVAAMLMLGAIIAFIPMPFTFIPFGLTVAWMGLTSFSPKNAIIEEPAHATP
jgi:uncharacterized protein (DUF2062 family)